MSKTWFKLLCEREQLQLKGTLNGGQSFRWKTYKENDEERWIGVFANKVWILRQHDDCILYQVYGNCENNEEICNETLIDYFQLHLDLKQLYREWSDKDPIFKKSTSKFSAIRLLHQDIVENIFSFICSTNNNIARITFMIEKLAEKFGEKICVINGQTYYTFPKVESLAKDNVEAILKSKGVSFGYRAKYVNQSAKLIVDSNSHEWLADLAKLSYEKAKIKLQTLPGVGPKVADCICLMSLGHLQSVPVDTHVYQIARNFYLPTLLKHKYVTTKTYEEIALFFRNLYGSKAGWAQTILFCSDLVKFKEIKGEK